ncbi:MAG: Asp-tRNA(Asn)/Glu-tRNA(Gln) amidotransferase subunit GatA [Planctomycetes bacterium]|nr:Asp-tRNA(Asn)/Glu-tRNA(Gln) amidotransferase subunit GatA [Planctomycetota bacterium]
MAGGLPLHALPAAALRDRIASREVSAEEAARHFLDRIARLDGGIGAFLRVDAEGALRSARASDARLDAGGAPRPLEGVPVAVKDNLNVEGLPTTCASRILEGFVAPRDATAVARLRAAGAVILGKTNLDEFAMGSSTENSAFGPTRNPRDPSRVPGGSSGGSAAAVAAGFAPLALGSDTGGSIRQPAALCGILGLKPTYGRVSRSGLVAFGSSLDQVGPLCRTAADAALALSVIAGRDPMDATSLALEAPAASLAEGGLRGMRVGVVKEHLEGEGLEPAVKAAVEAAVGVLRAGGAEVREVSLPRSGDGIAVYYLVATSEASSNLARFDGVRYGLRVEGRDLAGMYEETRDRGFGTEVKRRILLGTFALSAGYADAYYQRALRVRRLIADDLDRAFREVDVLVGPTAPTVAFPLGEKIEDPLAMYLCDVFAVTANLAGIPAVSVPCGADPAGLPAGFQVMAPALREDAALRAAAAVEAAGLLPAALPGAFA